MIDLLESYLGFAFILSAFIYGVMSTLVEKEISDDLKDSTALWLLGATNNTWILQCNRFFDFIFGPKHLSLNCFVRSSISSIISVGFLYVLFGPILNILDNHVLDDRSFGEVLLLGVIINLIPDFVSLMETRWVLRRFQMIKSRLLQALVLIGDLIFTTVIILVAIMTWRLLWGQSIFSIGELIGGFTIYSIFFYSTFLTSVWAWLYCISAIIMRLFSGMLSKVLNVESRPFSQLGLVGGLIIFIVLMGFKAVPDGRVKGAICKLPGTDMPYHCVRTASSADKQRELLLKHFGNSTIKDIDENFDHLFSVYGLDVMLDIAQVQDLQCSADEKEIDSCFLAAEIYFATEKYEGDKHRVATLFALACDGGYSSACYKLGRLYHQGYGVEANKKLAVKFYAISCEAKIFNACFNVGVQYLYGDGVDVDEFAAESFFAVGCDGGVMEACSNLGSLYNRPGSDSVDKGKVPMLYTMACEGGILVACSNLGNLYLHDGSEGKDKNEAIKLLQKACDGGFGVGCDSLGRAYFHGTGVSVNKKVAFNLFEVSCSINIIESCMMLGAMYYKGNGIVVDKEAAARYFEVSCLGEEFEGCSVLGGMFFNGDGVLVDKVRAAKLYDIACKGGLREVCDVNQ